MKNTLKIVIGVLLFAIIGCQKDEITGFDCFDKQINYSDSGEFESWIKHYYKNEYNVKIEYSNGDIYEYEYDEFGNTTLESSNEISIEYEYDQLNNLKKITVYKSGQLDHYQIFVYINNQLNSTYTINSSNDTTSWSNYEYKDDVLYRVEFDNRYSYYYYSNDIDSVITVWKNYQNKIKVFYEYLESKLVYEAKYVYDLNNEISFYELKTWEYNNELITKETVEKEDNYFSIMYFYNSSNLLVKKETYLAKGVLDNYEVNQYNENNKLIRIDRFDSNDNLKSYSIIEHSCN